MEHNEETAMGVIVNRPSHLSVSVALASHFELPPVDDLIFVGGPVEPSALCILYENDFISGEDQPIIPGVYAGSSSEAFEEVVSSAAIGKENSSFRVYSGYSGWGAGQLENEISRGDWYPVPASAEFIFNDNPHSIWPHLIQEYGNQYCFLAYPYQGTDESQLMPDIHKISLENGLASLTIAVDRGFNCTEIILHQNDGDGETYSLLDTLDGFPSGEHRPSSSGIPVLFPFPNRIKGGTFTWEGEHFQLPLNSNNENAIHGFVYDKPWRLIEKTSTTITGEFQLSVDSPDRLELWPADFVLTVTYELKPDKVISTFNIYNPDQKTLPWGLGTHPYFQLPLTSKGNSQECKIYAPASKMWELEQSLPTGKNNPPRAGKRP